MTEEKEIEAAVARARRGRLLIFAAALTVSLAAIVGLGAAVVANVVNVGQGNEIRNVHNDVTRIQKTPCSRSPGRPNSKCERMRQQLARGESIVSACIAHQRVTGSKGRNCSRYFVDVGRGGDPEPIGPSTARGVLPAGKRSPTPGSLAGSIKSNPSTPPADGHQPGGVSAPGRGGHQTNPAPAPSTGSPAGGREVPQPSAGASPSSSSSATVTTEAATGSEPPPAHSVLEAAGASLEEVGEAVGDALESVNGGLCALSASC